jgi:glyoxylate/hydroxypyruvate reductase
MAIFVAADFEAREWARWWPLLQAALPDEILLRDRRTVPDAEIEIALVANPPAGSLRGLPNLRLIQSLWAGVDRLLDDPGVPPGVPLARMVDPLMSETMAETALWAVLGLHRGFFDYATQQREALWRQLPTRRADEMRVAVLGLGQMGRAVARRLAQHGVQVIGWSRGAVAPLDGSLDPALEHVECHAGLEHLAAVLATAGIVINLLPLTPETRGLFNASTFAQMPRGASFVNLARGAHVIEADLPAALASGQLHRAVLDVFAVEPLPAAHAFWSHPSITVLPHVAAPTDPRSAVTVVACNVAALRRGEPLANVVDRRRGY